MVVSGTAAVWRKNSSLIAALSLSMAVFLSACSPAPEESAGDPETASAASPGPAAPNPDTLTVAAALAAQEPSAAAGGDTEAENTPALAAAAPDVDAPAVPTDLGAPGENESAASPVVTPAVPVVVVSTGNSDSEPAAAAPEVQKPEVQAPAVEKPEVLPPVEPEPDKVAEVGSESTGNPEASSVEPDKIVDSAPAQTEAPVAAAAPEASVSEGDSGDEAAPETSQALTLMSVNAESVTANSATIRWSLSAVATGQVEYGTSEDYGSSTGLEGSFRYAEHLQPLPNLMPDTEYHFRVRSMAENGFELVSDNQTFRTLPGLAVPQPSPSAGTDTPTHSAQGWPANTNGNLQMAGLFYGTPKGGLVTGNTSIGVEHSLRFRADKTGPIDAVRVQNRFLTPGNVKNRCLPNQPDSFWCKCVNAGLDEYSCGYTLPNSYSVGNGGAIIFEVRTDDGTSRHEPTDVVLGKTGSPFVPMDNQHILYPTHRLEAPVELVAGELYHVVLKNLAPPDCKLSRNSLADAARCPRDRGAISLNGTYHGKQPIGGMKWGPYLGQHGAGTLYRSTVNSGWNQAANTIGWLSIRYSDIGWVGDSYAGFDNLNTAVKGTQIIAGNRMGRQRFTVEDASREVDGLWLNYGHTGSANGQPLTVKVKDAAGSVLVTSSLPHSPECKQIAATASHFSETLCRVWKHTTFDAPLSLIEGQSYTLEFSAPAGADYSISSFFAIHDNEPERNQWDNAVAELSTNGGGSWGAWGESPLRASRDIPAMFTIVGMPRRMP